MPLDPDILKIADGLAGEPKLDESVLDTAKSVLAADEPRRRYLLEQYASGIASPYRGARLKHISRALNEITDPEDQQLLIEEVAKASRKVSQAEEARYKRSGFVKRWGAGLARAQEAYVDAGTGIVEAIKGLGAAAIGRSPTQEQVQFAKALEAAQQGERPMVPAYMSQGALGALPMWATTGAAGMAPDMAAGLGAGVAAGPAGMWGYWTARMFPEQRDEFISMGLEPSAATAAGGLTSMASGAVETFIEADPTGLTKGATRPMKRALFRGVLRHPLARRVVTGTLQTLKNYGLELSEEVIQAGTEGAAQAAAAMLPGTEERSLADVPGQMLETGKEAAPGLAGLVLAGGGGRIAHDVGRFRGHAAGQKRGRIHQEILEYAAEGKTPSRRTWMKWGLPPESGDTRTDRKEGLETLAKATAGVQQLWHAVLNVAPTAEQWRLWGYPEGAGRTEADRMAFLNAKYRGDQVRAGIQAEIQAEAEAEAQAGAQVGAVEAGAQPGVQAARPVSVAKGAEARPAAVPGAEVEAQAGPEAEVVPAGAYKPEAAVEVESADEAERPGKVGIKRKPSKYRLPAEEAAALTKSIVMMASPAHASDAARRAAQIFREGLAGAAQETQAAAAAMRGAWNKYEMRVFAMSPDSRIDFLLKMERGEKQDTPWKDEIAGVLRKELDRARERVQNRTGKLQEFYENYIPHLFKHRQDANAVLATMGGKKFTQTGFLRRRKYPDLSEAIKPVEEGGAGLELVTDNPIDLALMRIAHMNEYVAKTEIMNGLKREGLAKFVPVSLEKDYLPRGFEYVNDPSFVVQSTEGVTITEVYDKLLYDQLMGVINSLKIEHSRHTQLPGWVAGESFIGERKIRTTIGSHLGTLAHELGHQIGQIYGLYDYIVGRHPQAAQELELLSQLRYESLVPEQEFAEYVREPAEKEAVILEAWLLAPEKMEQVAPNVTAIWKEFLGKNREVRPLLMLDRSVVLGSQDVEIKQPGVRVLGRWALPEEVAKMVKNHLSSGIRRNEYLAVRSGWRLARWIGNAMNQASLSLAGFHAFNVMTDSTASEYALGLQRLQRGDVEKALKNFGLGVTLVGPGLKAAIKGHEIRKAMDRHMEDIENPEMRDTIESVIMAGGRAYMDTTYHNHAIKALGESLRSIWWGDTGQKVQASVKLPFQAIFAGLEATTAPIMQSLVPDLKLGVFYYMMEDIYSRAEAEGLSDFQIHEQLIAAWDSVDNRMGQLAYDNLFWNQYVKDIAFLAVRSVGWNLGSIREYAGAVLDPFTFRQRMERGDQFLSRKTAYAIGAVMTYAPIGYILTYLFTGEPPEPLSKDAFFPRTGRNNRDGSDERLSLPTYAKDWFGWFTNPFKTAKHKLHPMWGTLADLWDNEDYFGTEIRNGDDPWMQQLIDSVSYALEQFIPFSVRNYRKLRENKEPIYIAAPVAFSGISPAPAYLTRTPAQKVAYKYLSSLPVRKRTKDQAEQAKHRAELVQRLRDGEELSPEDYEGMTPRQKREIYKTGKLTPFQSLFKRLPLRVAMDAYAVANDEERRQVFRMLQKKRFNSSDITEDEERFYAELMKEKPQ